MKTAIIYVRGHNHLTQEIQCREYAFKKGYKIKFTTTDLNAVTDCDVLIITNPSRISRDQLKHYGTVTEFKAKGIEVEIATDHEDIDFGRLAKSLLK